MTNEEIIKFLQTKQMPQCGDKEYTADEEYEAYQRAINAVEREQQFLDAGYKNGRVEFMIGGRKFMVKEMAQ